MKQRLPALAAGVAALVVVLAGWWWSHAPDRSAAGEAGIAAAAQHPRGTISPEPAGGADGRWSTAQRAGTRSPAEALLARSGLRHQLEAVLLEAGEAPSPDALKARLPALAAQHFSGDDLPAALALLVRYVDYRVALGRLAPPKDLNDPDTMRAAVDARRALREQHFEPGEYQALFAAEEALDHFTLARLEIERQTHLTATQRQAALRQAEQVLQAPEQRARQEAQVHLAVAQETAGFDSQGMGEAERHARRAAQYGEPAAQQLAALDREERAWQERLDRYAAARQAGQGEADLASLRGQLFSAQEQLRLDAALALRSTPGSGSAR